MFNLAGMRPLSRHNVIKILKANGFEDVRSGKHITFKKNDPQGKVLTTYVPHHDTVTVFVLHHIIQQTGKSRDEFW